MGYKTEKILPYNQKEGKTEQVRAMFDNIAPAYDRFNHAASLGIDKWWRKKGITALVSAQPQVILDVATGTGDLAIKAFNMLKPQQIIGIDLSNGMLEVGRKKVAALKLSNNIKFQEGDCTQLSFADNTFDAVTAAFGVRNFADLEAGYAEMLRVLKPGGQISILELSTPTMFPMKQLFNFYSTTFLPLLGKALSDDIKAYQYLPETVKVVPQMEEMVKILNKVGFENAKFETLTFGICTLYTGKKPL